MVHRWSPSRRRLVIHLSSFPPPFLSFPLFPLPFSPSHPGALQRILGSRKSSKNQKTSKKSHKFSNKLLNLSLLCRFLLCFCFCFCFVFYLLFACFLFVFNFCGLTLPFKGVPKCLGFLIENYFCFHGNLPLSQLTSFLFSSLFRPSPPTYFFPSLFSRICILSREFPIL